MKVLVLPNFDKPGGMLCTRRTLQKLLELGLSPMLDVRDARIIGMTELEKGCETGPFEAMLPGCDVILTIGGDGTILHAVQESLRSGKPLLGINTGRIGFLTQIESDELDKLHLLRDGSYSTLHRMMLEVALIQDGRAESYTVLNDAVLSRGESERLVEIAVTRGGNPVASHRADGLIFSTPTGSTAYNRAAGGPVADPSLNLILMTAICSHSHFNHTLVLSPGEPYEAREVSGNNESGLRLTVDGRRAGVLRQGGHVQISTSTASVPFIDLGLRDFYHCVDIKLRVGK